MLHDNLDQDPADPTLSPLCHGGASSQGVELE